MKLSSVVVLVLMLAGSEGAVGSEANKAPGPTARSGYQTARYLILTDRNDSIRAGARLDFEPGYSVIGIGTIDAYLVFVGGKLYPGYKRPSPDFQDTGSKDPIGTFNFGQDFQMGPEAILNIEVRTLRKHDEVRVGDTAKLSGTLRVRFLGYRPKPGDRIPILRARQIVGGFTKVEVSASGGRAIDFEVFGKTGYLVVGRGGRH